MAGFVVVIIAKPLMSLGGLNRLHNADISCQLMKCNSKTFIVFAVNQALCTRRQEPAKGMRMNNQNWNPQHPQPAQQMPSIPQSKSGMAIAGFVLGIIALLTSFLPIINNLSFVLAILGLISELLAWLASRKARKAARALRLPPS